MNERNWGGARKGAGRKKGDVSYVTISIALPEGEADVLKKAAERQKMTVSRFVSKYLDLETAAKYERKSHIMLLENQTDG